MRLIALSVIVALSFAGAASAQDREPVKLVLVGEPIGQAFAPPPVRVVRTAWSEELANERAALNTDAEPPVLMARKICAKRVEGIYGPRDWLFIGCLRQHLDTLYTVIDLRDPEEVSAYYDTN